MAETHMRAVTSGGNTRREILQHMPAAVLAVTGATVALPALAADEDAELLARIERAQHEAEWILAQGGPDGAYDVDEDRYIRFEDDLAASLEDVTPTTAAGALALIGFALTADKAMNFGVPPSRKVWRRGLPTIVERCLTVLASKLPA